MIDVNKLMFEKEQFPIKLREVRGRYGKNFWDFARIQIPPYHPSMAEEGINLELAVNFIDEAIDLTMQDLEHVTNKREDIKRRVEYLEKFYDIKTGKIKHGEPKRNENWIEISPFPFINFNSLCLQKNQISPFYNGDHYIAIDEDRGAHQLYVPENVMFSTELMREYDMGKERSWLLGDRAIDCPNMWCSHNLDSPTDKIFYKNLVMLIDNAVVKRKYSE